MTIKQALEMAKKENIDLIDSKTLLKYILKKDVIIDSDDIEERELIQFTKNIEELKKGKPLQYITNVQSFYGENFFVNENVLIPQPDTEVLVEKAIEIINKNVDATLSNFDEECKNNEATIGNFESSKLKILDLCTGSGAIAISIKKNTTNTEIYASDISENALEVATKNAKKILKDENKIKFIQSDMFKNINEKFDMVVSNPPYIRTDEIKYLARDVQNEPTLALDGGKDGLDFYRIIRENIDKYLNFNGYLLMEIGYDQMDEVLELFENSYCIKDYAGNDRVVIFQKND